jgi:hypothetical protein
MIDHILDWIFAIEFGRFCFGFILIAIVIEVCIVSLWISASRKISDSIRKYKLERLDEFEYKNDLY